MFEEAFGIVLTIAFLVVSVLSLRILMDLVYNNLPARAQRFLDDHF